MDKIKRKKYHRKKKEIRQVRVYENPISNGFYDPPRNYNYVLGKCFSDQKATNHHKKQ